MMKTCRLFLLGEIALALTFSPCLSRAQATAEPPASPTETPAPATKPPKWEKEFAAFDAKDKAQTPPRDGVVFVGSSSFTKWKSLVSEFSEIPAINRGFGGSCVSDSVEFADRIVIPYQPRVVVLYAGGNDIEKNVKPAYLLKLYQAFDAKIFAALPNATIVHISLNPTIARAAHDPEVKESNRLLEEYCKTNPRLVFIETYSKMVGTDGLAQKDWMLNDGIHLNDIGYAHWKEIIKPVILETYQKTPAAK